ncbi:glycosyltransferase family 2 protein [Oerskovia paurometabola]
MQRSEAIPQIRYSVVIPVYGNEATLPDVVERLASVAVELDGAMEAVFVVDGSPDDSLAVLRKILPAASIASQLVVHSRNFGSFPAIRTGLDAARGEFIGVMAADLQEPPELMKEFFAQLAGNEYDVVVGRRQSRLDPAVSSVFSRTFWGLYRRFINRDIPQGGVDVFACTREVAARLLELDEAHSSLVGLLYWVGYRRTEVPYERLIRMHGKSGWTFTKKFKYLLDSVFSFTDIPIRMLTGVGVVGSLSTVAIGLVVLLSWSTGRIDEVGYTPLMLTMLFTTFLILAGLGVVGSYVWRGYENSKGRPLSLSMSREMFDGT